MIVVVVVWIIMLNRFTKFLFFFIIIIYFLILLEVFVDYLRAILTAFISLNTLIIFIIFLVLLLLIWYFSCFSPHNQILILLSSIIMLILCLFLFFFKSFRWRCRWYLQVRLLAMMIHNQISLDAITILMNLWVLLIYLSLFFLFFWNSYLLRNILRMDFRDSYLRIFWFLATMWWWFWWWTSHHSILFAVLQFLLIFWIVLFSTAGTLIMTCHILQSFILSLSSELNVSLCFLNRLFSRQNRLLHPFLCLLNP